MSITIPDYADCFCTNYSKLYYHVLISDNQKFIDFCKENNIKSYVVRGDLVIYDGHIFTSNKNIFNNFPKKVYLLM